MNSGKQHRVQFANIESEEEDDDKESPMYTTWSLWTSFLRSVNRAANDMVGTPEPEVAAAESGTGTDAGATKKFPEFYASAPEKISRVNFKDSPKLEEVVLPLDWAEYLIFKERMHRRRSTGSHIIRGIQRIRIKRLRSQCSKQNHIGSSVSNFGWDGSR
jgi:hypothetical protein